LTTIVRSRALLLVAKELGLEGLDPEVLEAFAVSASGPRDLILFSIAVSLRQQLGSLSLKQQRDYQYRVQKD
jgi:hypothetical protein